MDRHESYRLLAKVLNEYRELPFGELSALVGGRHSERTTSASGEEFILDVSVAWSSEEAETIRVSATVDSPSSYRLERVEGEILVSGEIV